MSWKQHRWLIGLILVVVLILGAAAATTIVFGERIDATIRDAVHVYLNDQLREIATSEGVDSITVEIGVLEYGVLTQSLHISGVSMQYVDSTEQQGRVLRGSIESVDVSGLAPWSVLFGSGLSVGTIAIQGIDLDDDQWSMPQDTADKAIVPAEEEGRVLDSSSVSEATLPRIPNVDSLLNTLVVSLLPENVSPLDIGQIKLSNISLVQQISTGNSSSTIDIQGACLSVKDIDLSNGVRSTTHLLSDVQFTADHVSRTADDGFSGTIAGLDLHVDRRDTLLQIDSVVYHGDTLVTERLYGVRISLAERLLRVDSVDVRPNETDKEFFRQLHWRGDRAIIELAGLELRDLDLGAFERGEALRVREIHVDRVHADVTTNLAAPKRPTAIPQLMPHEIMAVVPFTIAVDSLVIEQGSLTFGEIHPQNLTPGHLYWDSIRVIVTGLSNERLAGGSPPMVARATGRFMHMAPMYARFETDLGVDEYHLRATGGMGRLDLSTLNSFMPYTDNVRLTGIAEKAVFSFTVNGRRATGTVDAVYRDLEAELLEADTKETNIFTSIVSWAANWLVIKNDNPPGDDHTVGVIHYTVPRNAAIMQSIWFPLRSGLGDIAGIPIKE